MEPDARRRDSTLIAAAAGLLLAAVLPQYLVASVAVAMRADFPFSNAELGVALGVSFGLSAVLAPTAGRAIGRLGVRGAAALSSGLVAGSSIAIATVADSAAAITVLMAINGIGGGLGSPTFAAILAGNVAARRQGLALGTLSSAPQFAAFCGGLALPLVVAPFGWRASFLGSAAIGIACLAALLSRELWMPPRPVPEPGAPPRRRLRVIHVTAFSSALASTAGMGMRAFLVLFAVSIGFSSSSAGLLLSLTGLLAIVSRLGFATLAGRRRRDPLLPVAALMAAGAVGYALMAVEASAAVVIGAMIAGGLGWGWQAPLNLAVLTSNPHTTGSAIGIQMAGFFAGALVGPPLVGLIVEHGSYRQAWLLCVVFALVAAGVMLFARSLTAREARAG